MHLDVLEATLPTMQCNIVTEWPWQREAEK